MPLSCTMHKHTKLKEVGQTQYLPTVHFQLPWRDPWGNCHQNVRCSIQDRPPSLCKISANLFGSFGENVSRTYRPDRQTNSKFNICHYHGRNKNTLLHHWHCAASKSTTTNKKKTIVFILKQTLTTVA